VPGHRRLDRAARLIAGLAEWQIYCIIKPIQMERVMIRYVPAIALVLVALAAPAAAADRSFALSGFDQVASDSDADVIISTGKPASVEASGPQDRIDRLEIVTEGATLRIRTRGRGGSMSRQPLRVAISLPELRAVTVSGPGDVVADGASGPSFVGRTSGSGDLKVANLDSNSVKLHTSGSGDVEIGGICESGDFSSSGSGTLRLGGLRCGSVRISTTGSGNALVNASGNADLRTTGSGDITVTGGARCTSRSSGSGNTSCS